MSNSIKRTLAGAAVVLGIAVVPVLLATAIVLIGATGRTSNTAPRLSSAETYSHRQHADYSLRHQQQFRRAFVSDVSDGPR
jgi:hypothetical protein